MSRTVADQMVETLSTAGVRRIYGIVGDSLNGFTDALRRHGGIDWLHVRHEEVAAFAAGADAYLTGGLAVCAGSCGPGNLHLINGLFDCHRSRVPVVAIAAHIPSPEIGSGYFQETHPERLFRECSSFCELVSSVWQMPRALEIAIRRAIAERCVSVIVIPGDIALKPGLDAPSPQQLGLAPARPTVTPSAESIDRMAALLNSARRVTLLCGAGCEGAHDQLIRLAGRLKSPIVHAMRGKEHLHGERISPGDRRATRQSRPTGRLTVGRWRVHDADGRCVDSCSTQASCEARCVQQRSARFIELEQKSTGFLGFGTDFVNPNFAAMAEAVGIEGVRIENPAEVDEKLAEALSYPGPVLVDAVVNRMSLPCRRRLPPRWPRASHSTCSRLS